jgi:TatD DNase family protein
MIDSHCHLTDPRLYEQLPAVLERARVAGVERMITIGTDPEDGRAALALCREHPQVRCALGVHPNYCGRVELDSLSVIRDLQSDPLVLAVGETGLDYHYDFAERSRQRRFFEAQVALASELNKPVVIHCREATDDALSVLRGFPTIRAVFHCFTGSVEEASRILSAGFFLGLTGAATFRKSESLREVARTMPRDRLLIETDAPYLTPEPLRKIKTNEPSLVVHVADAVAREWQCDRVEVDRVTTENTRSLFGWG